MTKNASQAEQSRVEQEYRMKASVLDAELDRQLKILESHLQHKSDTHNAMLDHASKSKLQDSKVTA